MLYCFGKFQFLRSYLNQKLIIFLRFFFTSCTTKSCSKPDVDLHEWMLLKAPWYDDDACHCSQGPNLCTYQSLLACQEFLIFSLMVATGCPTSTFLQLPLSVAWLPCQAPRVYGLVARDNLHGPVGPQFFGGRKQLAHACDSSATHDMGVLCSSSHFLYCFFNLGGATACAGTFSTNWVTIVRANWATSKLPGALSNTPPRGRLDCWAHLLGHRLPFCETVCLVITVALQLGGKGGEGGLA